MTLNIEVFACNVLIFLDDSKSVQFVFNLAESENQGILISSGSFQRRVIITPYITFLYPGKGIQREFLDYYYDIEMHVRFR